MYHRVSYGHKKSWNFENAFSRPGKVMDFRENGWGHAKVMEFYIFVPRFCAVWKLETFFVSSRKNVTQKGWVISVFLYFIVVLLPNLCVNHIRSRVTFSFRVSHFVILKSCGRMCAVFCYLSISVLYCVFVWIFRPLLCGWVFLYFGVCGLCVSMWRPVHVLR